MELDDWVHIRSKNMPAYFSYEMHRLILKVLSPCYLFIFQLRYILHKSILCNALGLKLATGQQMALIRFEEIW